VDVVMAKLANALAVIVMPFLITGIINRMKSLWSGRKGPPLLQPAFDVLRLLHKSSVYSETTTPLFRIAPWVFLLTALGSAVLTPLFGSAPLVSFHFDFIWFAYVWALGRVGIMLAALDTGSAFEGMGSAREATFSTLLEPVLFLTIGALCLSSGADTLHEALLPPAGDTSFIVSLLAVVALSIVLQVEAARMPVDDPTTHLELTMVHEVMVLDHSGPDLAAIQYGAATKLYVMASIIATLLNPWAGRQGLIGGASNLVSCLSVAVVVGTIESLIARLKLRVVPKYIAAALSVSALALLATAWRTGAAP
jgi:formate hydrogenlyase subunit 4